MNKVMQVKNIYESLSLLHCQNFNYSQFD